MRKLLTVAVLLALATSSRAENVGWRRNGTGLYPEAKPPVKWSRRAVDSVVKGLVCRADKPVDDVREGAVAIPKGHVLRWLVVGPFEGANVADLDRKFLKNETTVEPKAGDKVGPLEWKPVTLLKNNEYNDKMFWAPANESERRYGIFCRKMMKSLKKKVFYAHSYVYSREGGATELTVSHVGALKVMVNGKEVFKSATPNGRSQLSVYAFKKHQDYRRLKIADTPSNPRVRVTLKKGWNRLLVKSQGSTEGKYHATFYLCFADRRNIKYENKNIRWVTRLPDWGISSPIVVGNKLFVSAEPDLLLCLDKMTGKILWTRSTAIYHSITKDELAANPELGKIAPLARKLENRATSYSEKYALRKQIQDILHKIDKVKYAWPTAKSLPTTGLTFPTPVSDGKHVWVFYSHSIAACYDLEGNRKWIRNMIKDVSFTSTGTGRANTSFNVSAPILIGDKLILLRNYLAALDKNTGKLLWKSKELHGRAIDKWHDPEKKVRYNANFSSTPTTCLINGEDLIVCGYGTVVRASDGKILAILHKPGMNNPRAGFVWDGRNTVWCVTSRLMAVDLGGKPVKAKLRQISLYNENFYSAPFVHNGLIYQMGIRGFLSVNDAKTGKEVYRQKLDLEPFFFGWALGCSSSPTLGGKYIYIMDNQLNTIIIKPGRKFVQVAKNRIDNFVPRRGPDRQQDSPMIDPVFDGDRIYIRGERDLFCIGK